MAFLEKTIHNLFFVIGNSAIKIHVQSHASIVNLRQTGIYTSSGCDARRSKVISPFSSMKYNLLLLKHDAVELATIDIPPDEVFIDLLERLTGNPIRVAVMKVPSSQTSYHCLTCPPSASREHSSGARRSTCRAPLARGNKPRTAPL